MAEHINAMRCKIIVYTHTLRKGYVTKSGKRAHEMCCVPSDCVLVARLQILAFASALDSCFSATISLKPENIDSSQFGRAVVTAETCDYYNCGRQTRWWAWKERDWWFIWGLIWKRIPASCFPGQCVFQWTVAWPQSCLQTVCWKTAQCKYCYEILLCARL